MSTSSTDRIEKSILIKAPRSRVWAAIANADEFGAWFQVDFHGRRFEAGKSIAGNTTYPGYEHVMFVALVAAIEPEHYFAFRWHPYAVDPAVDYSSEPMTLAEFHLETVDGGTLLRVVESGFDALPTLRAREAFPMNSAGWQEQLGNVQRHVER